MLEFGCTGFDSFREHNNHAPISHQHVSHLYLHSPSSIILQTQVNPVTHAVGNTIKRVVIIVASVVAFKTPMSTGSIIGSSVAIAGTLMYSLAMNASKSKKD